MWFCQHLGHHDCPGRVPFPLDQRCDRSVVLGRAVRLEVAGGVVLGRLSPLELWQWSLRHILTGSFSRPVAATRKRDVKLAADLRQGDVGDSVFLGDGPDWLLPYLG